jgi:hypothetical protein
MNLKEKHQLVARCDSQHRAPVLIEVLDQSTDDEAKELLLSWFNCCDAIGGENYNKLRKHFERCDFISDSEKPLKLPKIVYRAVWEGDNPEEGLSWTGSKEFAQRFARLMFGVRSRIVLRMFRENTDALIYRGICTSAYAHITDRGEDEIIVRQVENVHEYLRYSIKEKE